MNIETFKSLLYWFAFGALAFWMMRRGACSGMILGRSRRDPAAPEDGRSGRLPSESGRPMDPVCGMEVDPAKAAGTRLVSGQTYFLCSPTCLAAFDENPDVYTDRTPHEGAARHRHAGCC